MSAMSIDVQVVAAGERWDAIKVSEVVARPALERLGQRTGAVIEDRVEHAWYWLIPAGTSAGWEVAQTRPCGVGSYVGVPAAGEVPWPRLSWRVPPSAERYLTDPAALHTALEGGR